MRRKKGKRGLRQPQQKAPQCDTLSAGLVIVDSLRRIVLSPLVLVVLFRRECVVSADFLGVFCSVKARDRVITQSLDTGSRGVRTEHYSPWMDLQPTRRHT